MLNRVKYYKILIVNRVRLIISKIYIQKLLTKTIKRSGSKTWKGIGRLLRQKGLRVVLPFLKSRFRIVIPLRILQIIPNNKGIKEIVGMISMIQKEGSNINRGDTCQLSVHPTNILNRDLMINLIITLMCFPTDNI